MEFGIDVDELVLLLHLLAFFEFVVDPLSSAEQVAKLGVRGHDLAVYVWILPIDRFDPFSHSEQDNDERYRV